MKEKSHVLHNPHLQSSKSLQPSEKTCKMIGTIRFPPVGAVGNSSRVDIGASTGAQLIFPLHSVHLLKNAVKHLTQYLAAPGQTLSTDKCKYFVVILQVYVLKEPLCSVTSGWSGVLRLWSCTQTADRSAPRTALTHRPWSQLWPFIT